MKKIAALIIIFISFLQCTNDTPMPNGYELLDRENKVGLMPPVTIHPTRMATYWDMVPAGTKSSLLLGAGKDARSFILFQNRNLAKIDPKAGIISATLSFYSSTHVGETSPLAFTAHRFTRNWDEATVVWTDVQGTYAVDPVESWEYTPGDTAWYSFEFSNTDFIAEWIQSVNESEPAITGMLLAFDEADGGTIFYSSESSSFQPTIKVVSQNTEGGLDTTVAYVTADASLLQNTTATTKNEIQENPETLKVGNGTGFRNLLQFDLSGIPKEATIHKALLTFQLEPAQVWGAEYSSDGTFSVAIGLLDSTSTWSDPSTLKLASGFSSALDGAAAAKQTFAFDSPSAVQTVSRIVQAWVSGKTANTGAMLYPNYQTSDFYEMAFKSGVIDASAAPSLEITYALPAAHRFAQP